MQTVITPIAFGKGFSREQLSGSLENVSINGVDFQGFIDHVYGEVKLIEKHLESETPKGTTIAFKDTYYSVRENPLTGQFILWDGKEELVSSGQNKVVILDGAAYRVSQDIRTSEFNLTRDDVYQSEKVADFTVIADGKVFEVVYNSINGIYSFSDGLKSVDSNPFSQTVRLNNAVYSLVNLDSTSKRIDLERESIIAVNSGAEIIVGNEAYTWSWNGSVFELTRPGATITSKQNPATIELRGRLFEVITTGGSNLTLKEMARSENVADQTIIVSGIEYVVKKMEDGRYYFSDGSHGFMSNRGGNLIELNGYKLDIILTDEVKGDIALVQREVRSTSVADQVIEIITEYPVDVKYPGQTFYVTEVDGVHLFSDGVSTLKSQMIEGVEILDSPNRRFIVKDEGNGKISVCALDNGSSSCSETVVKAYSIDKADGAFELNGKTFEWIKKEDNSHVLKRGDWSLIINPSDTTIRLPGETFDYQWSVDSTGLVLTQVLPSVSVGADQLIELDEQFFTVTQSGANYIFKQGGVVKGTSSGGTVNLNTKLYTVQIMDENTGDIELIKTISGKITLSPDADQRIVLGGVDYDLRVDNLGNLSVFRDGMVAGYALAASKTIEIDGVQYQINFENAQRKLLAFNALAEDVTTYGKDAVVIEGQYYRIEYDSATDTHHFISADGYVFTSTNEARYQGQKLVTINGATFEVGRSDYGDKTTLSHIHSQSETQVFHPRTLVNGEIYEYTYDYHFDQYYFDNGYGDPAVSDPYSDTVVIGGVSYHVLPDPLTGEVTLVKVTDYATTAEKTVTIDGKLFTVSKKGVNSYRFDDGTNPAIDSTASKTVILKGRDYFIEVVNRDTLELILHEIADYNVADNKVIIGSKSWTVAQNTDGGYDFTDSTSKTYRSIKDRIVYIEGIRFEISQGENGLVLRKIFDSQSVPSPIEVGGKIYLVSMDVNQVGKLKFDDGFKRVENSDEYMKQVTLTNVNGDSILYNIDIDPYTHQVVLTQANVTTPEMKLSVGANVNLDGVDYTIEKNSEGDIVVSKVGRSFNVTKDGYLYIDHLKYFVHEDIADSDILHFDRVYNSAFVPGQIVKLFNQLFSVQDNQDGTIDELDIAAIEKSFAELKVYDMNNDGVLDERDLDVRRGQITLNLREIRAIADRQREVETFIAELYNREKFASDELTHADSEVVTKDGVTYLKGNGQIDDNDVEAYFNSLEQYLLLDVEGLEKKINVSESQTINLDGVDYAIVQNVNGSVSFIDGEYKADSNTARTSIQILGVDYVMSFDDVTSEYRISRAESQTFSDPNNGETARAVLGGRSYEIKAFGQDRWEVVRGPDHYIQNAAGQVTVAGIVYDLSYNSAAKEWTFTRTEESVSSIASVILKGIEYRIEKISTGNYVLKDKYNNEIIFNLNDRIVGIEALTYSVSYVEAENQFTFEKISTFEAAGGNNQIRLLNQDFTIVSKGNNTFDFVAGGQTYTSNKVSDQYHTVRIGWYTYDVSLAAGDGHIILKERNVASVDAPISPDLAKKLAREVIWETYSDVDKNGLINSTDRVLLYVDPVANPNGASGVLVKSDINRDGQFDVQDELVLAAMIERQKLLRKADVDGNFLLDQNDVVRYEKMLKDGISWDIDGDGATSQADLEYLKKLIIQENFKNRLRERLNTDGSQRLDNAEADVFRILYERMYDYDGDEIQSLSDYQEVVAIKDYVASLPYSLAQIASADLNGDHQVDHEDLFLLQDSLKNYKDVDGDGQIDEDDVLAIQDLLIGGSKAPHNIPQFYLPYDIISKADVNKDGIIDEADLDYLTDHAQVIVDNWKGSEADRKNSFATVGEKLTTSRPGGSFGYDQVDMPVEGGYLVGLDVLASISGEVMFEVRVDGMKRAVLSIDAVAGQIVRGNARIDVLAGDHDIEFIRIDIPDGKMDLEVHKFYMTHPARSQDDINSDGILTNDDWQIIGQIQQANVLLNRADINQDGVFDDRDLLAFDSTGSYHRDVNRNGNSSTDPEDRKIIVELLAQKENAQRADINSDGFVDLHDVFQLRQAIANHRDLNGDGEYNEADVEFLNNIAGEFQDIRFEDLDRSDLNGDRIVDGRDLEFLNLHLSNNGFANALSYMASPQTNFSISIGSRIYNADETARFLNQFDDVKVEDDQLLLGRRDVETFNSAITNNWATTSGLWEVENGLYRQNDLSENPSLNLLKTDAVDDFVVSADFMFTGKNAGSSVENQIAGIILRAEDENNYYDIVINRVTRRIEFRKVVDGGEPQILASQSLSTSGDYYGDGFGSSDYDGEYDGSGYSSSISDRVFYNMSIEASGTNFRVLINGEYVFDVTHGQFDAGQVGLTTQGVEAKFDNFTLTTYRSAEDIIANEALETDLDMNGKVNAFDYAVLGELKKLASRDLTDGGLGEVNIEDARLLESIARSDLNADGFINAQDLKYIDLNDDGMFSQADADKLETIVYLTQTIALFSDADIDGNKRVDYSDLDLIELGLKGQFDVNGDGYFNTKDLNRINDVMEWQSIDYSDDIWNDGENKGRADINGDKKIDFLDIQDLVWSMNLHAAKEGENFKLDLNEDGKIGRDDLLALEEILDLLARDQIALPIHMELANINKDGVADEKDLRDLDALLTQIENDPTGLVLATTEIKRYDQNQDGKLDREDYARMQHVIQLIRAFKTRDQEDVNRLDVNDNGIIELEDLAIASRAMDYFINIDGLNKVDNKDIEIIQKLIRKQDLAVDEFLVSRSDLNGDGNVNDKDTDLFDISWKLLPVVDKDGNGWMEKEEVDFYLKLIGNYIDREIRTLDIFTSFDINSDDYINRDDLDALEAEIAELYHQNRLHEDFIEFDATQFTSILSKTIDVNVNGVRNQEDIQRIRDMIEFKDLLDGGIDNNLFVGADIDENRVINQVDINAAKQRLLQTTTYDLNFDGEVDQKDIDIMNDMIFAVKDGEILEIGEYLKRDMNGDGRVTQSDVDMIWDTIRGHVDLSIPKDGIVDYNGADGAILADMIVIDQKLQSFGFGREIDQFLLEVLGKVDLNLSADHTNVFSYLDQEDIDMLEFAMAVRDNDFYDLDRNGVFNERDVYMANQILKEVSAPLDRILQPEQFDLYDVDNNFQIDMYDREAIEDARNKLVSTQISNLIQERDALNIDKLREFGFSYDLDTLERMDFNKDGKISGLVYKDGASIPEANVGTPRVIDLQEEQLKKYNDPKSADYGDYTKLSDINAFYHHWFERIDQDVKRADRNGDGYINEDDVDMVKYAVGQLVNGEHISYEDQRLADVNNDHQASLADRDLLQFVLDWAQDTNGDKVIDGLDAEWTKKIRDDVLRAKRLKNDMNKIDDLKFYDNPPTPIVSTWIDKPVIELQDTKEIFIVTKVGLEYFFDDAIHAKIKSSADGKSVVINNITYQISEASLSNIDLKIDGVKKSNKVAPNSVLKLQDVLYQISPLGTTAYTFSGNNGKVYKSLASTKTVDILIDDVMTIFTVEKDDATPEIKLTQTFKFTEEQDTKTLLSLLNDYKDDQKFNEFIDDNYATSGFDEEAITRALEFLTNQRSVESDTAAPEDLKALEGLVDAFNVKANRPPAGTPDTQLTQDPELIKKMEEIFSFLQIDTNGDKVIDPQEQAKAAQVLEKLLSYSLLSQADLTRADLNHDGLVNGIDESLFNDSYNRDFDVNGDTLTNQTDLDLFKKLEQYLAAGITKEELEHADQNQDSDYNDADLNYFSRLLDDYGKADYNEDGMLTAEDIQLIESAIRAILPGNSQEAKKSAETYDLDGDTNVNMKDYEAMLKALEQNVDIDGDGFVTPGDVERIFEIIESRELNIENIELANEFADVDNNGVVSYADKVALSEALDKARDVNGDTFKDEKDIKAIEDLIELINFVKVSMKKKSIESVELHDYVTEVEGRIVYIDRNSDNTYTLTDDRGNVAITNVERIAILNGVWYKVKYDDVTRSYALTKLRANSVVIFDTVIELGGVEYSAFQNADGTYVLQTEAGEKYYSQPNIDTVLIDNKPYRIYRNTQTGEIEVERIHLETAQAFSGNLQYLLLNDKVFTVSRQVHKLDDNTEDDYESSMDYGDYESGTTSVDPALYTQYFVFNDGENVFHNTLGQDTIKINGVTYLIDVNPLTGFVNLIEKLAGDFNRDGVIDNKDEAYLLDAKNGASILLNASDDAVSLY
jgi:hypothetical protein